MPLKDPREVPAGSAAQAALSKPVLVGPSVIAGYLKTLPSAPGVYRMLDATGTVIYVGKARNLKARVTNYARAGNHANRIVRMIAATASMEFVSVRTEAEALLLEANLIKRFRPRFNVLLRDDKSFPFILLASDHRAPQIVKHRGARNRKGEYFGPFASAGAVNRTINMLERAFLLRSCSDAVFESRTRPCLLHQIKRCSAPCTGEISLDDYNVLVDEAVRFLRGESQNVREMYQTLMAQAAERLDYEQAASYRNRLWALAHVTADQAINPEGIEEADVFAAHQEMGQTCVQVFFFRSGQNWGNRAYFPRADRSFAVEEVLENFIAQFYDDKPVPRLILLSHRVPNQDLLADALSTKADRGIELRVPQRGAKTGVVEHALQNAREALGRKLAENSSQRALLEALRDRFGPRAHPAPGRGVRQQPHPGHQRRRRHDRRRSRRVREEPVPQVQYQGAGPGAGRRLRHDARGADAKVQETGAGRGSAKAAPPGSEAQIAVEARSLPGTAPHREPQTPPLDRRGGNALAFGVMRRDETENAAAAVALRFAYRRRCRRRGHRRRVSARPDLVLIDGGAGPTQHCMPGIRGPWGQRHRPRGHRQGTGSRRRARAFSFSGPRTSP